jgi:hypothetical protein
MICKEKWKSTLLSMAVALFVAAMCLPAAAAGAPKYPDLRTLPPSELHLGSTLVSGQNHYVVRFSNIVANVGTGTFELHGTPHFPYDGLFDASQWIYDDSAGLTIEPVGVFAFHPSHQHFHFDGFARYELWKETAFQRAEASGFTTGKPMYTSPKVSFCVLDLMHQDTASGPPVAFYQTCSPAMEGISPGWADIYDYLLPEQWVDVGQIPLLDGKYVLRSIADPGNLIFESTGKADASRESQVANSAVSHFSIVNGRLGPS